MADTSNSTREERLAAQLRANLKRRKAQARVLAHDPEPAAPAPAPAPSAAPEPLAQQEPPR